MTETLGPFNLVVLALPGIALKIALRIMYGRRAFAATDPLKLLLSIASTMMLVLAFFGMVIGLVGFWWMLIPLPIIFIVVIFMTIDRFRHAEHRALVWCLATAAERGIPLQESARAYSDEVVGDTGARALALAQNLEAGMPLSLATRMSRLRTATPMRLAIRVGEALGMLGPMMRQQIDDTAELDAAMRSVITRIFYLGNIICVSIMVITFVMIKIMPVYKRMFEEFGLKLPAMTELVINLSNLSVSTSPPIFLPLAAFLLLLILLFFLTAILYFVGWFPRDLPIIWRWFRRYDGALVMRGLAATVRRNLPVEQGLAVLAEVYPIRHIGWELAIVRQQVLQGTNWLESLQAARLVSAGDAAVLSSAERVGNLAWALEEMGDSAIRRQVYRLQLAINVLFPLAILVLAGMTGMFVIGVFLPLIALIQGLA